jgi:hypothetical protein
MRCYPKRDGWRRDHEKAATGAEKHLAGAEDKDIPMIALHAPGTPNKTPRP